LYPEHIDKIKKIALIAIYSDDDLMDLFVLKGGSAIDIIYGDDSGRASIDLDFSLEKDFEKDRMSELVKKIEDSLERTFSDAGYITFDFEFTERPKEKGFGPDFWGGYKVVFKVTEKDLYEKYRDNTERLRKSSMVVGLKNKKKFQIDISKYEYCAHKRESEVDDYIVYVYTPEMIVFEKIRAICQQMPEYEEIIKSKNSSPRSADFFDIYYLMERFRIDILCDENRKMLKEIFEIKQVPTDFIMKIKDYREFHRQGFDSLKDTVRPGKEIREFDFYFDYVIDKFDKIFN